MHGFVAYHLENNEILVIIAHTYKETGDFVTTRGLHYHKGDFVWPDLQKYTTTEEILLGR